MRERSHFQFFHLSVNINYGPLFPAYVLDFNYCNLTDSCSFSIINIQNNIRNLIPGVQGKKMNITIAVVEFVRVISPYFLNCTHITFNAIIVR